MCRFDSEKESFCKMPAGCLSKHSIMCSLTWVFWSNRTSQLCAHR